ncbi:MAG TPA: hypothetical protein VMT24_10835, partial [Aggregatilineaceae bacterium]|nr:hypothetical protein [Aggregatilineaceae bacterium]
MSGIVLLRVAVIVLAIPLLAADRLVPSRYRKPGLVARAVLALFAVISALFMLYLFVNHINFPLHLEIMEGLVLQHFERASKLQVVYPEPSPQYVPLAYNPLYYAVSIPAGWIFGVNLFTLRLMAIIAMIGTAALLFKIVWDRTHSLWWATIVVGLFAAAYRVMDSYLDTAHSDSWLLFSAVLGSYI